MNNEHKQMLEYLESVIVNAVIDEDDNIIDFKLTGYSFNTFDNTIYPEFLAIIPSTELFETYGNKYFAYSIHSTLEKYNSLFFNNYFTFILANIKVKVKPQV